MTTQERGIAILCVFLLAFVVTITEPWEGFSPLVATLGAKEPPAQIEAMMPVPTAGDVVAAITGPTTAAVGELCILDSSSSQNATAFSWVAVPSTVKNWLVVDGGKRCVVTQPKASDVTLILAASNGTGLSLASRTVTFGASPQPAPVPTPPSPVPVPPTPNPPTPGFDFQAGARSWKAQVTGDPTQVLAESLAIAAVFESVAASADSGTFTSTTDLVQATGNGIATVLTDNSRRAAWKPFATGMTTALNAESTAGRLTTVPQHAAAWHAMAAGLR